MVKLIVLSGLPGSGKSTRAKEIVEQSGDWVRVNKDSLRPMLHCDKPFQFRQEKATKKAERAVAKELLSSGYNIVVDDTNLTERHVQPWKDLAKELNAKFEHIVMDASIEDCISRDERRGNDGGKHIGKSTIINMARQSGMGEAFGQSEVIFDVDGTIADLSHRLHYIQQEPKDWNNFFEYVWLDSPILENIKILEGYHNRGYRVILMSGRDESTRENTEWWLAEKKIPYYTLIMRPSGDHRPDDLIKEELFNRYCKPELIEKIYDDRPRVIRMWTRIGMNVVDVGDGVEF